MENQPFEVDVSGFDALDEEDLLRMDERSQRLNEPIVDEVPTTEETSESTQTTQPQQTATSKEAAEPKEEEGNALKTTAEAALAIPTGTLDWGISLYNKVMPGEVIDLPNIPKFQNEVTQSIRDISSVVVPTILITKGLGAAGAAAHTKVG